jgi:hypothetical protein
MVTFECFIETCPNCNIPYNFLGEPETAVCGGCGAILEATDPQPDPVESEPEIVATPKTTTRTAK